MYLHNFSEPTNFPGKSPNECLINNHATVGGIIPRKHTLIHCSRVSCFLHIPHGDQCIMHIAHSISCTTCLSCNCEDGSNLHLVLYASLVPGRYSNVDANLPRVFISIALVSREILLPDRMMWACKATPKRMTHSLGANPVYAHFSMLQLTYYRVEQQVTSSRFRW